MSENARILVIDDEKNYLLVLEALLADAGYSVTAINDPEMALAFLDDSEVDVVITDMKMPKMTGKEVLQSIKKSWSHIPVLIMTAFGSIESAVEVMRYGAFDYITKPFASGKSGRSLQHPSDYRQIQSYSRYLEYSGSGIRQPFHSAHYRRIRHGQGACGQSHSFFFAA